ncbi:cell division protein ZapA [Lachnospiraceae bacterium NK3A20]|jgi:cell division protein ZapA|nr:cell division protein ZapA [Lachnospiraceae bacterium NK3A20]
MASNANKTSAEVIIDGKVYTLAGYESADYIQRIATYLNGKISEFQKNEGYSRLTTDYKNILMQINIADDYFRLQKQYQELQDAESAKVTELYNFKSEKVATDMKLAASEKTVKELREANDELSKKIIRLETEIKTRAEDARNNR